MKTEKRSVGRPRKIHDLVLTPQQIKDLAKGKSLDRLGIRIKVVDTERQQIVMKRRLIIRERIEKYRRRADELEKLLGETTNSALGPVQRLRKFGRRTRRVACPECGKLVVRRGLKHHVNLRHKGMKYGLMKYHADKRAANKGVAVEAV